MAPAIVKPLDEFKDNLRDAHVPPLMRCRIETDIAKFPTLGECAVRLFPEPGFLPNAGFYIRRHAWAGDEGRSIHLYLSRSFPVYLYNFIRTDKRDASWLDAETRGVLLNSGLEVYRELTMEFADD